MPQWRARQIVTSNKDLNDGFQNARKPNWLAALCSGIWVWALLELQHFAAVMENQSHPSPPANAETALQHGVATEINAVGKLVGKVLPVYLPETFLKKVATQLQLMMKTVSVSLAPMDHWGKKIHQSWLLNWSVQFPERNMSQMLLQNSRLLFDTTSCWNRCNVMWVTNLRLPDTFKFHCFWSPILWTLMANNYWRVSKRFKYPQTHF